MTPILALAAMSQVLLGNQLKSRQTAPRAEVNPSQLSPEQKRQICAELCAARESK